jgi:hypothetical protein
MDTIPTHGPNDSTSNELIKNQSLKRYQLKPKKTESGIWTISFVKHSKQTLFANVSVTSQPFNPNAIQMRVILKDADINTGMPPIIVTENTKRKQCCGRGSSDGNYW